MKRIYLLIAMACMMLLILVTCRKNENSNQIEKITFSKNFDNSVSEINMWFEYNFISNSKFNSQEIAVKKEIVESYYRGYLLAVENEKHEVYFKWVKISAEPLEFRLTAYVTPPPKKGTPDRTEGKGSGVQETLDVKDPPRPPQPPPPPM